MPLRIEKGRQLAGMPRTRPGGDIIGARQIDTNGFPRADLARSLFQLQLCHTLADREEVADAAKQ